LTSGGVGDFEIKMKKCKYDKLNLKSTRIDEKVAKTINNNINWFR
jgi:hypothetical protein